VTILGCIWSFIKINITKQWQNKEQKGVSRWRRLFCFENKDRVMYNPIINTIGTDMEGEKTE